MKLLKGGLADVWSRKRLWAGETLLLGAMLAGFYGWLMLPVATVYHLALHVLSGVALLCLVLLGALRAYRAFGAPRRLGVHWILPVPAVWCAWLLVRWVPQVGSLPAEAASAAVRLTAAAALVTGAVLWTWACAAREEEPHDEQSL